MKTMHSITHKFFFTAFTIALALIVFPHQAQAQATYSLAPKAHIFLKVLGTSNVNDWEMVSTTMQSKGEFKFNASNVLTSIRDFQLAVNPETFKKQALFTRQPFL